MDHLAHLETRLGYRFQNKNLLEQALTHASSKDEQHPSNERLEFLGDAVLGLVIAHFLFDAFPGDDEGRLTRLRSGVVSTEALGAWGVELGLDQVLRLGKGLSREALSPAILANCVEALIGAAFLDGGLDAVQPLVLWGLAGTIEDALTERSGQNWKSQLQEHTQQTDKITPTYEVLEERGPDHRKEFVVAALVAGEVLGCGHGPSKKLAEQAAAREAFEALQNSSS